MSSSVENPVNWGNVDDVKAAAAVQAAASLPTDELNAEAGFALGYIYNLCTLYCNTTDTDEKAQIAAIIQNCTKTFSGASEFSALYAAAPPLFAVSFDNSKAQAYEAWFAGNASSANGSSSTSPVDQIINWLAGGNFKFSSSTDPTTVMLYVQFTSSRLMATGAPGKEESYLSTAIFMNPNNPNLPKMVDGMNFSSLLAVYCKEYLSTTGARNNDLFPSDMNQYNYFVDALQPPSYPNDEYANLINVLKNDPVDAGDNTATMQSFLSDMTASDVNAFQNAFPGEDPSSTAATASATSDTTTPAVATADDSSLYRTVDTSDSTYESCPDSSVPSTDAECSQKIDTFSNYINTYPTDASAIQTCMLFVNNLADSSQLNTEMKQQLIQQALQAMLQASSRASSVGGNAGEAQFLNTAIGSLQQYESSDSLTTKDLISTLIQAMQGQLPAVQTNAAPTATSNKIVSLAAPAGNSAVTPADDDTTASAQTTTNASSNISNNLASKGVVAASPPPPSVGSNFPNSNVPAPDYPWDQSGCPVPPTTITDDFTTMYGNGMGDYLEKLYTYMAAHPTDPAGPQYLLVFFTKLSQHYAAEGKSIPQEFLQFGGTNGSSVLDAIMPAIIQGEELAFFSGYGGSNGKDGMTKYLNDMATLLNGLPSNDFTNKWKSVISQQKLLINAFANDHTADNGDLIWTVGNMTYNWTNPTANPALIGEYNDQFFITQFIQNQGSTMPNPFVQGLESDIGSIQRNYRMGALDQLLQMFADPSIAITIWLMTVLGNDQETANSGFNETTDVLTMMTNAVATHLTTLAQNIGETGTQPNVSPQMTPEQALDFRNTLAEGSFLMDTVYQLSGLSSEWDQNVFQAISGLTCGTDFGFPAGTTVGDILFGTDSFTGQPYTPTQMAQALCSLNPLPPTPTDTDPNPTPTPNQGFQAMMTILQQAGSYITGQSKTVSMEYQQGTDWEAQWTKSFSSILQNFEQFISYSIKGQKTQ